MAAVGVYNMTSMSIGTTTIDMDDLTDVPDLDEDILKLELREDGTFDMTVFNGQTTETTVGSWHAEGNEIELNTEGEDIEGYLSGDTLTLSEDDIKIVFVKQ